MDIKEQQMDKTFDLVAYEQLRKGGRDAQAAIKDIQGKMKMPPEEVLVGVAPTPANIEEIMSRTHTQLIEFAQYSLGPPPNIQYLYRSEIAVQALCWHMERLGSLALENWDHACRECPPPEQIKTLCDQIGAAAQQDARLAIQVLNYTPQWASVKQQIKDAQIQLAMDMQLGTPVASIKSFIFKYFLRHKQLYDLNAVLSSISKQNRLGLNYE